MHYSLFSRPKNLKLLARLLTIFEQKSAPGKFCFVRTVLYVLKLCVIWSWTRLIYSLYNWRTITGVTDMNQKQYLNSTTMEYHTNRSCQRERQLRELISISGLPPSEYSGLQICIGADDSKWCLTWSSFIPHYLTRFCINWEGALRSWLISAAGKRSWFWSLNLHLGGKDFLANMDCGRQYDATKDAWHNRHLPYSICKPDRCNTFFAQ